MSAISLLHVLPDMVVIELQAIANDTRRHSWRIGQLANQIIRAVEAEPDKYIGFGRMDVYEAVAIGLDYEYTARSVREFAYVEACFTREQQAYYSELPFSHFRFAASLIEGRRMECLELSRWQMGETGRPPSVEWLYTQLFGMRSPAEPSISDLPPVPEKEISRVRGDVQEEERKQEQRWSDGGEAPIPTHIAATFEVMQDALLALPLPNWTRVRIRRMIEELSRLIIDNLIRA